METRPLALHQVTAVELEPRDLVVLAGELGCDRVCLFTYAPDDPLPGSGVGRLPFHTVTPSSKAELLSRMRDCGVGVSNVEFFPIGPATRVGDFRSGFELGRELGAGRAVVHIHDHDDARALATLARTCELAAEYDLAIGLEFMGFTACDSIQRATFFAVQVAQPNIGLAVDALHLVRTGGSPDDVAALPASLISYAQICDGRGTAPAKQYRPEAMDRLAPGEGDFPLPAILAALPAHTPLDVEVPSATLKEAGMPARERAARAVSATRRLLSGVEPSR
jgi:sugar phosphate isomerase/epimerase